MNSEREASRRRPRHARSRRPRQQRGEGRRSPLFWAGVVAAVVLTFVGFSLIGLSRWSMGEFGVITVEQAKLNLQGTGEGATDGMRRQATLSIVVWPLVLTGVTALIAVLVVQRRWIAGRVMRVTAIALPPILVIGGVFAADHAFRLREYLEPASTALDMADYYREPELLSNMSGDDNLILIYLESMDDAYGDASLVEYDALESLQRATEGWSALDTYTQIPVNGGWTIAAMVATQCGFPLRAGAGAELYNDERDAEISAFLPGATCLGDVLADQGYNLAYLGGARAEFAGKGAFLSTHGFSEVMDADYWEAHGETEFSAWGLSDRRLFENAKEQALALQDEDGPFFLAMLTLDNHNPVYESPYCEFGEGNDTLSAMRCQSGIVAEYIDFLGAEGIMEDTTVVVVADHQMLGSYEITAYRQDQGYSDTDVVPIFNRFYSPTGAITFNRTVARQVDLYPTILELLGADLKEGRAGLGVSLVSDEYPQGFQGTVAGMTDEELSELLRSDSADLYERFWESAE